MLLMRRLLRADALDLCWFSDVCCSFYVAALLLCVKPW
jgi:hypothetical protein